MTKQELALAKIKFGEHVQKIMDEKKLSFRKVAANCSLTHSKIQEITIGKYDIRLHTILELAKGLEVPPYKLLDF